MIAPLRRRLLLVNPGNPLVTLADTRSNRWNRYRVWKPLGLLALAAVTPAGWEVTVVDENLGPQDYEAMPVPDLVGVTAFTSQAERAYAVAAGFRARGVPVVMGGIHATVRPDEAGAHVDAVVRGEAEEVWPAVLADALAGGLRPRYEGGTVDLATLPSPRHDLLAGEYAFGSIQTTRGCPLDCSFCSVSAVNGRRYRRRPVAEVVAEFRALPERWVLVVDDNLIGTSRKDIARAKELFRAMIAAGLRKKWICQATINLADDEELLRLARRAGCRGAFIGFESPEPAGLAEVGKKFNLARERDFPASVRRIQRHRMLVVGSFIMGLDSDAPGVGARIADAAHRYGVDILNAIFLTPLPGTRLYTELEDQDRIAADDYPNDWRYYTLTYPTARYRGFSWEELVGEMRTCDRDFYSRRRVVRRCGQALLRWRQPLIQLVGNLTYRWNALAMHRHYGAMDLARGARCAHPVATP